VWTSTIGPSYPVLKAPLVTAVGKAGIVNSASGGTPVLSVRTNLAGSARGRGGCGPEGSLPPLGPKPRIPEGIERNRRDPVGRTVQLRHDAEP